MDKHPSFKLKIKLTTFIVVGCIGAAKLCFANAGYTALNPIPEHKKGTVVIGTDKKKADAQNSLEALSSLQMQARDYRAQGYKAQSLGDLPTAKNYYHKAIELDPEFAVAYNDLGVIAEAEGDIDDAERCYKQALTIDPNYLSVYTNLACLYENKRDLVQAAAHWKKRIDLGSDEDPWTLKAQDRLRDINLVLSNKPVQDAREQEALGLLKDVVNQKELLRRSNTELALDYFKKAKSFYKKGEEATALKLAIDASQLDPRNESILEFIDKLRIRLLSK